MSRPVEWPPGLSQFPAWAKFVWAKNTRGQMKISQNRDQQRDPEMHQTKKGKGCYLGMKAHVGVDSKNKIIHTVMAGRAILIYTQALSSERWSHFGSSPPI